MQPSLHKFSWLNNRRHQWASEFHRSPAYRGLQHDTLDEPMDQSGSAIHTYIHISLEIIYKEECGSLEITINQENRVHRVKSDLEGSCLGVGQPMKLFRHTRGR